MDALLLLGLYVPTLCTMCCVGYAMNVIGFEFDDDPLPDHWSYIDSIVIAGITAPVVEETVFRILPFAVYGFEAMVLTSIVWALLHASRAPIIAVSVPMYVYLVATGHGLLAIAVHVGHNTAILTVHELWERH